MTLKPTELENAIARLRVTHKGTKVNRCTVHDLKLVCDAAEKVVRANEGISSAPPALPTSQPGKARYYDGNGNEEFPTFPQPSEHGENYIRKGLGLPAAPAAGTSACPLPAKLEEAIQNALVTLDECNVPAAEWLRKEINITCDQWLATRAQQQLAADEIVGECVEWVENRVSVAVGAVMHSDLKGKFLLSAQPNGGLTAFENADVLAIFQKRISKETLRLIPLQEIFDIVADLNLALSEPRT